MCTVAPRRARAASHHLGRSLTLPIEEVRLRRGAFDLNTMPLQTRPCTLLPQTVKLPDTQGPRLRGDQRAPEDRPPAGHPQRKQLLNLLQTNGSIDQTDSRSLWIFRFSGNGRLSHDRGRRAFLCQHFFPRGGEDAKIEDAKIKVIRRCAWASASVGRRCLRSDRGSERGRLGELRVGRGGGCGVG